MGEVQVHAFHDRGSIDVGKWRLHISILSRGVDLTRHPVRKAGEYRCSSLSVFAHPEAGRRKSVVEIVECGASRVFPAPLPGLCRVCHSTHGSALPVLTHRVEVIRLALGGKTTTEICQILRHSPEAMANYLGTFTR